MKTIGLILTFNIILICIGIIAWFRVHLDMTCTSEFFEDLQIARVRRTTAI